MRPSSLGGGRIMRRTLSVRLSVRPVIGLFGPASVTLRHLANYNDTHVLFGTRWGPHIVRPSRPHRFLFLQCRYPVGEAEWNRRCLCRFDIMHNAYVVVTCSCFVVNDIYQWKTLQRICKTEPIPRQKLWGRAEAEAVWSRPRQDRVRPRRGRAS